MAKKEKVKEMSITFAAKNVKVEKKDDGDVMTVTVVSPIDFLTDCVVKDETLDKFLEDVGTKRYIAAKVGVKGLLAKFDKKEVLTEVTWDYVKEFFMDHMDVPSILDYIGYEKVGEHFSDKIQSESGSKNVINKGEKRSILEELNESEGQAK